MVFSRVLRGTPVRRVLPKDSSDTSSIENRLDDREQK